MPQDVSLIPSEGVKPKDRGIAWWVENTFKRCYTYFINGFLLAFGQTTVKGGFDFIEEIESELIELGKPIFDEILKNPDVPEFLKVPVRKAVSGEKAAGLAVLAFVGVPIAQSILSGVGAPLGRKVSQGVDFGVRSNILDPGTVTLLLQRGIISHDRFKTLLSFNGIAPQGIDELRALSYRTEDETELTQAYWRKIINRDDVRKELVSQGYTLAQVDHWLIARELIPSPTDLVSMAVREAFDDRVAARFGYDENYPTEAAQWAEKQGLGQDWFKRYWRAHWTLPGVTQVREMYNRGIINEDDVNAYLRAADLPVFWRNAFTQWFKAEITRVDVRRLYDLGVITIKEVYERYLRLGYTTEDSALMTQWTAAEYLDSERELTKTDILSMYRDGILNTREATSYLTALDYRVEDITLLLAHQDLKREQAYESRIIEIVKDLFIGGIIDRTDVFSELGKLDTPGYFIEDSLAVWDLEKKHRVVTPTITQIRDMTLDGIITVEEFREELRNKGYSEKYIKWYEKLWEIKE